MSLLSISKKNNLSSEELIILNSELEKRKPSKIICFILWFMSPLGIFAFHRIYTHDYKNAILMIISLGGFFIWGFTDIFRIDSICKKRTEQIELEVINDIQIMKKAKEENIEIQKL